MYNYDFFLSRAFNNPSFGAGEREREKRKELIERKQKDNFMR